MNLLDQKYAFNDVNLAKKLLHSKLLRYIVNESQLKKIVERVLIKFEVAHTKNYIDYPCLVDFHLSKHNAVIIVKDHAKIMGGTESTIHTGFLISDIYYRMKGFNVIYITYKDYDLDETEMYNNILAQLKSSKDNA